MRLFVFVLTFNALNFFYIKGYFQFQIIKNVFRCQILTSKVGPRAERVYVKAITMNVSLKSKLSLYDFV